MYIGSREYFLDYILRSDEERIEAVTRDISRFYHTFQIPKNNGYRTIQAISSNSELYWLQKKLCQNFLDKIPLPIPAIGFVKEESYLTFLKPHIGKRYYLRLDIQSFFDSITENMLRRRFGEFFAENEPKNLEDFLTLCTYQGRVPQGAVTSPAISNVVFRQTDQRILKYCQSFDFSYRTGEKLTEDICYTRYADDMLFSSNCLDFSNNAYFIGMISWILQDEGFLLNKDKVKFGRGEISLSGFLISQNIHLSRKKLYSINKLLHFLGKTEVYDSKHYRVRKAFFQEADWLNQINRLGLVKYGGGAVRFQGPEDFLNYLCGYRSFLLSVLKANDTADADMRQLNKKIGKLEAIIECVIKAAGTAVR